jgi:hypothetical protein
MATMWDKAPASRLIKYQNLSWTGTGVAVSTGFASQTFQIRVVSQVAGAIAVDVTGVSSTVVSTAGGGGAYLPASIVPEYITVSPSEILSFSSTSTSSGTVSVAEMG